MLFWDNQMPFYLIPFIVAFSYHSFFLNGETKAYHVIITYSFKCLNCSKLCILSTEKNMLVEWLRCTRHYMRPWGHKSEWNTDPDSRGSWPDNCSAACWVLCWDSERDAMRTQGEGFEPQRELCLMLGTPSMLRVPWTLVEGGGLPKEEEPHPMPSPQLSHSAVLVPLPASPERACPPPTWPLRQLNHSPGWIPQPSPDKTAGVAPFWLVLPSLSSLTCCGLALWPLSLCVISPLPGKDLAPGQAATCSHSRSQALFSPGECRLHYCCLPWWEL